ncbi:hypothetical protein ACU6U9_05815 [Pseudomonas sp. HK3]|jgi:hypothetical protein
MSGPLYQTKCLLTCVVILLTVSDLTHARDLHTLSDEALDSRYQFIKSRLTDQHHNAFWWQHGWGGIYAASSIVETTRWSSADTHDEKVQFRVSAIKSILAFASIYANPLPSSRIYQTPTCYECEKDSRAYKIHRLKQAEEALKTRALRASNIHSVKRHGVAVAFNLLAGLYIAKNGDRKDGIASAVGGIISSEINIFTQPSRATQDWQDYQQLGQAKTADTWNWQLMPTGQGIQLSVGF